MFFIQTCENLTQGFEIFLQNRRKYCIFCNFHKKYFCKFSKILLRPKGSAPGPHTRPAITLNPWKFSCVRHWLPGQQNLKIKELVTLKWVKWTWKWISKSSLRCNQLSKFYSLGVTLNYLVKPIKNSSFWIKLIENCLFIHVSVSLAFMYHRKYYHFYNIFGFVDVLQQKLSIGNRRSQGEHREQREHSSSPG